MLAKAEEHELFRQEFQNLAKAFLRLADQADRINKLVTSLAQRTPQADAVLAPEILVVMAGGAGSGVRLNEAEMERVVKGRSNLESLRAALNKWNPNNGEALSVTDSQRQQNIGVV